MPLDDRVAVITGAAGSLGPTVCREFARAGARLALAGTRLDPLNTLAASLKLSPERVLTHAANLTDPGAVQALAGAVSEKFGRTDIVIHLVGGYNAGATVVDLDPANVAAMLDQHLWTTLHVARAFTPGMLQNGWGRIVVVSTPLAQAPGAKQAPYAVGKAAQETLMMTLAQELKGSGVTANCLQIRSVETAPPPGPAIKAGHGRAGTVENPPPEGKPRTGSTPEEITAALLWLCGDEAGAVNGGRVPVFGRA